jgi:Protein of unknown function (DUF3606)
MSDDKTKRRPQDSSRISMHEPYEVNWWTDHFGVSRTQLQAAVNAVGHGAGAVARYLGKPL